MRVIGRVTSLLGAAVLIAACSSSTNGTDTSARESSPTTQVTAGESTVDGVALEVVEAGTSVAREVTPEAGGELTLEVAPGVVATLSVPPGALATSRMLRLVGIGPAPDDGAGPARRREGSTTSTTVPVAPPGMIGVAIEPAGVWLATPARLTFSGVAGEVLARVSPLGWYASAAVASDGSVPVVRLRPFVVDSDGTRATDVPIDGSWDDVVFGYFTEPGAAPGFLGFAGAPVGGVEGLDQAARKAEADAADGDPDSSEHGDAVVGEARRVVESLKGLCGSDPLAARRTVEALRTANAPLGSAPTCVKVSVRVFASYTAEINGPDLSGLVVSEEVLGVASGVVDVEELVMTAPLEGVSEGIEKFSSVLLTGLAWGGGQLVGVDAPPPTLDACSMSKLQGGSLTIAVAPLPEQQLRVTVTPTAPGTFVLACGTGTWPLPSTVWEAVAMVTGGAPGSPIVFNVPKGVQTTRILSQFTDRATQGTTIKDGVAEISEEGSRISVNFSADVDFANP